MQARDFHAYLYGPDRKPLETSFESAKERLEELPGLFFELDGSFAWMQERGNNEIYGILYDAGGRIQYCDLHGKCPKSALLRFCSALLGGDSFALEVLLLPGQKLQDFQEFVKAWDETDCT